MSIEYNLLRINLTKKSFSIEKIDTDLVKNNIGGKGIGSVLLMNELKPRCDPLGPDNKLIFVAGPLTGTLFPTGNRYGLFYKSPFTGTYAESYSGGGVVQKMRGAGYFIVIIEGSSDKPIYIHITEDGVIFNDAYSLWGMDTHDTYYTLEANITKDLDMLCIGPAGENLIKIANIQNNLYHSAGRCGPGAVMGSKMLKAIVFSGKKRPLINQNPKFKELVKKVRNIIKDKPEVYGPDGVYRKYGTPIIVNWANTLGCFTQRYFTQGYSEFKDSFTADTLNETILKKRTGCWNCPFPCGKHVVVEYGPYKCELEGPEYETIAAFGGMCDIRDISAIAKLNDFCDRVGIDTISAGSLCGLAIESKKRGRIAKLEKIPIDYNKPMEVLRFLRDMVDKKGIAAEFGEGTKFIETKYHLQDYAMHVKGLDFAGYDPRPFRGFALSYGVSPEGPTHLRSVYHGLERNMGNRREYKGKAADMIEQEDKMAIIDSLIVCKFIRAALDWDLITEIYNVIFDENIDENGIRAIAQKMVTLSRKFNVQEGFSRKDDYLPDKVYKEPLSTEGDETNILDREKYGEMLDEYYELRGWSKEGIPSDDKLLHS